MPRCTMLLLLSCLPLSVAVAAPVPPGADLTAIERAYGTWADPDKDCNFKLTGGELKVSLPASGHLLGTSYKGTNNAPRAMRDVEGDFTAVVRVVVPVPDKATLGWSYASGAT